MEEEGRQTGTTDEAEGDVWFGGEGQSNRQSDPFYGAGDSWEW